MSTRTTTCEACFDLPSNDQWKPVEDGTPVQLCKLTQPKVEELIQKKLDKQIEIDEDLCPGCHHLVCVHVAKDDDAMTWPPQPIGTQRQAQAIDLSQYVTKQELNEAKNQSHPLGRVYGEHVSKTHSAVRDQAEKAHAWTYQQPQEFIDTHCNHNQPTEMNGGSLLRSITEKITKGEIDSNRQYPFYLDKYHEAAMNKKVFEGREPVHMQPFGMTFFEVIVDSLELGGKFLLYDTHAKILPGLGEPDFVLMNGFPPYGGADPAVIGEFKKRRQTGFDTLVSFSPSDEGEIIDYMNKSSNLRDSTCASCLYGLLFNGHEILLAVGSKSGTQAHLGISYTVMTLSEQDTLNRIRRFLLAAHCSHEAMRPKLPLEVETLFESAATNVVVGSLLGFPSSAEGCSVYSLFATTKKGTEHEYALKYAPSNKVSGKMLKNAVAVLRSLEEKKGYPIDSMPRVVKSCESEGVYYAVFTHVGTRVQVNDPDFLSQTELCTLADTLAFLHCNEYVHRDVELRNLIRLPGGMCLIDYGAAVRCEKKTTYAGASSVGSPALLQEFASKVTEYQPKYIHDLWCLVQSYLRQLLYRLGHTVPNGAMETNEEWARHCEQVGKFWDECTTASTGIKCAAIEKLNDETFLGEVQGEKSLDDRKTQYRELVKLLAMSTPTGAGASTSTSPLQRMNDGGHVVENGGQGSDPALSDFDSPARKQPRRESTESITKATRKLAFHEVQQK